MAAAADSWGGFNTLQPICTTVCMHVDFCVCGRYATPMGCPTVFRVPGFADDILHSAKSRVDWRLGV